MFGGEQVSLSLKSLPEHKMLRVSVSLFMLNPVDGSSTIWGPDVWDLTVDGGPSITLQPASMSACPGAPASGS